MPLEPVEPKQGDTRILVVDGRMIMQVNAARYGQSQWIDVPSVAITDHLTADDTGKLSLMALISPSAIHVVSIATPIAIPQPRLPFALADGEMEADVMQALG